MTHSLNLDRPTFVGRSLLSFLVCVVLAALMMARDSTTTAHDEEWCLDDREPRSPSASFVSQSFSNEQRWISSSATSRRRRPAVLGEILLADAAHFNVTGRFVICYLHPNNLTDMGFTFSNNLGRLKAHKQLDVDFPNTTIKVVSRFGMNDPSWTNAQAIPLLYQAITALLDAEHCQLMFVTSNSLLQRIPNYVVDVVQRYPLVRWMDHNLQWRVADESLLPPNGRGYYMSYFGGWYVTGAAAAVQCERCVVYFHPGNGSSGNFFGNALWRGMQFGAANYRRDHFLCPLYKIAQPTYLNPKLEFLATEIAYAMGCDIIAYWSDGQSVSKRVFELDPHAVDRGASTPDYPSISFFANRPATLLAAQTDPLVTVLDLPAPSQLFSIPLNIDGKLFWGDTVLTSVIADISEMVYDTVRDLVMNSSFHSSVVNIQRGTTFASLSPRAKRNASIAASDAYRQQKENLTLWCGGMVSNYGVQVFSGCVTSEYVAQRGPIVERGILDLGMIPDPQNCPAGTFAAFAKSSPLTMYCVTCRGNTFSVAAGTLACSDCPAHTSANLNHTGCNADAAARTLDMTYVIVIICVAVAALVLLVVAAVLLLLRRRRQGTNTERLLAKLVAPTDTKCVSFILMSVDPHHSASHWRQDLGFMTEVYASLHSTVVTCCARHRGYINNSTGDIFLLVTPTAKAALELVIDIKQTFAQTPIGAVTLQQRNSAAGGGEEVSKKKKKSNVARHHHVPGNHDSGDDEGGIAQQAELTAVVPESESSGGGADDSQQARDSHDAEDTTATATASSESPFVLDFPVVRSRAALKRHKYTPSMISLRFLLNSGPATVFHPDGSVTVAGVVVREKDPNGETADSGTEAKDHSSSSGTTGGGWENSGGSDNDAGLRPKSVLPAMPHRPKKERKRMSRPQAHFTGYPVDVLHRLFRDWPAPQFCGSIHSVSPTITPVGTSKSRSVTATSRQVAAANSSPIVLCPTFFSEYCQPSLTAGEGGGAPPQPPTPTESYSNLHEHLLHQRAYQLAVSAPTAWNISCDLHTATWSCDSLAQSLATARAAVSPTTTSLPPSLVPIILVRDSRSKSALQRAGAAHPLTVDIFSYFPPIQQHNRSLLADPQESSLPRDSSALVIPGPSSSTSAQNHKKPTAPKSILFLPSSLSAHPRTVPGTITWQGFRDRRRFLLPSNNSLSPQQSNSLSSNTDTDLAFDFEIDPLVFFNPVILHDEEMKLLLSFATVLSTHLLEVLTREARWKLLVAACQRLRIPGPRKVGDLSSLSGATATNSVDDALVLDDFFGGESDPLGTSQFTSTATTSIALAPYTTAPPTTRSSFSSKRGSGTPVHSCKAHPSPPPPPPAAAAVGGSSSLLPSRHPHHDDDDDAGAPVITAAAVSEDVAHHHHHGGLVGDDDEEASGSTGGSSSDSSTSLSQHDLQKRLIQARASKKAPPGKRGSSDADDENQRRFSNTHHGDLQGFVHGNNINSSKQHPHPPPIEDEDGDCLIAVVVPSGARSPQSTHPVVAGPSARQDEDDDPPPIVVAMPSPPPPAGVRNTTTIITTASPSSCARATPQHAQPQRGYWHQQNHNNNNNNNNNNSVGRSLDLAVHDEGDDDEEDPLAGKQRLKTNDGDMDAEQEGPSIAADGSSPHKEPHVEGVPVVRSASWSAPPGGAALRSSLNQHQSRPAATTSSLVVQPQYLLTPNDDDDGGGDASPLGGMEHQAISDRDLELSSTPASRLAALQQLKKNGGVPQQQQQQPPVPPPSVVQVRTPRTKGLSESTSRVVVPCVAVPSALNLSSTPPPQALHSSAAATMANTIEGSSSTSNSYSAAAVGGGVVVMVLPTAVPNNDSIVAGGGGTDNSSFPSNTRTSFSTSSSFAMSTSSQQQQQSPPPFLQGSDGGAPEQTIQVVMPRRSLSRVVGPTTRVVPSSQPPSLHPRSPSRGRTAEERGAERRDSSLAQEYETLNNEEEEVIIHTAVGANAASAGGGGGVAAAAGVRSPPTTTPPPLQGLAAMVHPSNDDELASPLHLDQTNAHHQHHNGSTSGGSRSQSPLGMSRTSTGSSGRVAAARQSVPVTKELRSYLSLNAEEALEERRVLRRIMCQVLQTMDEQELLYWMRSVME